MHPTPRKKQKQTTPPPKKPQQQKQVIVEKSKKQVNTYLCTIPNRPIPIFSPIVISSNGISHSLSCTDS